MFLNQHTHIIFVNNHAKFRGGAIHVAQQSTNYILIKRDCFFQADQDFSDIRIDFINNTAGEAGSSLYIPPINRCDAKVGKASGQRAFEMIFNLENTESDPSTITSDPSHICSCLPGHHMAKCSEDFERVDAYPGQDFTLRLAVLGTMDGAVPGAIQSYPAANSHLGSLQDTQQSDYAYCQNFTYTVFSTDRLSYIALVTAKTRDVEIFGAVVTFKDCPIGFSLDQDGKCGCDPVISRNDISCLIESQSILRPANTWIGFVVEDSYTPSNKTGVVFSEYCPLGYCLSRSVHVTSDDPDVQCTDRRTGVLCGQCVEGYSFTLGSQRCYYCSDMYLLLLFPLAVLGIVLVAVLFLLNLTVTDGSINGLIFYSNVVAMSHSIRYSDTSSQLYTFFAWLNLDLGITTCFYDGMDAYAETWLQFAFPLYLWLIIVAIIFLFNKFPGFTRRGTQNAVKVLATLLLLSYTKLQRNLVTIFSFTTLTYPNGAVHYVWLYDANVQYLKGKHLILFMAGVLVLLFLILPYTFVLTFFQCFQACSAHRVCRWVNRLKPVFDSYAGPYKDRYRMWTGLLLVTRTVLLIFFSCDITGSPHTNSFIILMTSLTLLMLSTRGIYKKWPYDFLETFFYVQLGIFSGGSIYTSFVGGNISALAGFSCGTSLLVFLLIVGYRIFCILKGVYHKRIGHGVAEPGEDDDLLFHDRESNVPAGYMREIQCIQT